MVLIISIGFVVIAHAAPTEVYQGVLGSNIEVVLELSASKAGEMTKGRYFYPGRGVDIPLRGTHQALAEGLPLNEFQDVADFYEGIFEDPATHKPRIVWAGHIKENRYVGTWRNAATGKSLPFNLKHVATYDPDKISSTGDLSSRIEISMANTPYDYLRVNVPLTKGKENVQGHVAYRMVNDPRTHIAYPRLTQHPDTRTLTMINRLLEQRHWTMNLEALACASSLYFDRGPAAGSLGGYEDENINVEYFSSTLMSVVESGSTFCGGAHPNNHYDTYTLDLLHGGYFDFSRILQGYGPGNYPAQYSEAFMHFVREALQRKGVDPGSDDFGCTDEWPQYLYLHVLAPDRLSFDISGVGHALGVCLGSHLTLSFTELEPILKPDSARYLQNGKDTDSAR